MDTDDTNNEVKEEEGVLEWWSVTDEEVKDNVENIKDIPKDGFKELSVHGYQQESLTSVPHLVNSQYFSTLIALDLRWNRITGLNVDILPVTLEIIVISHNDIQAIPALARFSNLKEFHANKNQIVTVDPNIPISIEIIDLSNNNIQAIPPMDKQVNLKQLFLSYNYIYHISNNQLPVNVETINLSHNYISSPIHLDQLTALIHCDLSHNRLKQLHSQYPPTLQVLDLSYNNIQNVPSLQTTQLKYLDLTDTIVVRIYGLPPTINVLKLADVTSLKLLTADCFPTEAVYHVISKALLFSQVFNLAQPAPHVFNQGYKHLQRYYTKQFTCNSKNRIILTGEPECGKTSLARTLNKGRPTLTHSYERTEFMKIITWKLDEETSFRIYDHGGNDVNSVINFMFTSNKSNVFICHDLSNNRKTNFERSISHLSRAVQQQPDNYIHFVLTHVDKLYTQSYFESLNQLKKAVNEFWSDTMADLKNQVNNTNKKQIHGIMAQYKERKEGLKYFSLSCKTNKGVQDFKDFLIKSTDENRVLIPDYWLNVYSCLKQSSSDFLTFNQVVKSLHELENMSQYDEETIKEMAEDGLKYFDDLDIVVWRNNEVNKYVFHNLGFLIDAFASIFQPNLEEYLQHKYEESQSFQEMFTGGDLENMISLYKQGLLKKQMILYLWRNYELVKDESDALLDVMKSFNLLYPIRDSVNTIEDLLYCPWMVTNTDIPDDLSISQPMVIDFDNITLHLENIFHNGLPNHVCNMMFVCLQRLAVKQRCQGQRYSWTDGLMIKINRSKYFVYREHSILSCVLQGPVDHLAKMWQLLAHLYDDLKKILRQWRGLVVTSQLLCPHCVTIRLKHPYKWSPEVAWAVQLEGKANVDYVMCPHDLGEDIPTGLIQQIAQDNENQVKLIKEYLKENWIDTQIEQEVGEEVKKYFKSKLSQFQAIMFTQPVIKHLHEKHVITDRYKQKLEDMNTDVQIESLLKKLIVRRTMDDMVQFRQVLEDTNYHTNITLAKLIPDRNGVIPKDPVELLTKNELKVIKDKFYKVFYEDIGAERVIPHLESSGLLHKSHYKAVSDKITSQAKAGYILDNVLLRGTYETVQGFRRALLQCNSKHIAGLLPARKDDPDLQDSDDSDISEIEMKDHSSATDKKKKHKGKKSVVGILDGRPSASRSHLSTDRTTLKPDKSATSTRSKRLGNEPSTISSKSNFQAYEGEVTGKSKFCSIS